MKVKEIVELQEAYLSIYEDNTFEDLLEFCLFEEIFDTEEEAYYFVEELIENDLVEEFVIDNLEYYGYPYEEIALYESKGKAAVSALRGVINAFSAAGRTKAGLSAATALGKSGQAIKGSAASTSIRSARAAARSGIPAPEKPGKYLDMLTAKRKPVEYRQGSLLTSKGKAQDFRGGKTPFVGTEPVKATKRLPAASPQAPKPSPGQLGIPTGKVRPSIGNVTGPASSPQRPPASPSGSTGSARQSGTTQTVRATLSPSERAGDMKYPGLSRYADTGREPPMRRPPSGRRSTAASVSAIGAAGLGGTAAVGTKDTSKSKPIQTDVYNTMDPSGKIRSRKKVGPRLVGNTFEDAFREARKAGKKTFKYGKDGKEFTTKLASEEVRVDLFDHILEYLVAEGYADTNENALAIMTSMSEEWKQSIVEGKSDRPLGLMHPFARGMKQKKGEKREEKYGQDSEGNLTGKYSQMQKSKRER